jgi:hypothetical protein
MFYPDAERIRLMISHDMLGQEWATDVVMPLPMADELVATFPEIEAAARSITFFGNEVYRLGENYLSVAPYLVDAAYIDMLTFDYVEGSKKDVLEHLKEEVHHKRSQLWLHKQAVCSSQQ